ncbi:hypothetical protein ACFOY8_12950 [Thalassospira xianhensis]|uniref:Uncharacterized protein n=1 Tax=Thalassospira xianhensis MCCC 1A02616 TaxID=1177929 RepID=A0A367UIL0_9PROT|nr:hypothetical protein [Thalassospira xianhensis]RCK07870.1 hypothetical protein TH5_02340 [Thalassospira xianhensis MCCC 1A02616]
MVTPFTEQDLFTDIGFRAQSRKSSFCVQIDSAEGDGFTFTGRLKFRDLAEVLKLSTRAELARISPLLEISITPTPDGFEIGLQVGRINQGRAMVHPVISDHDDWFVGPVLFSLADGRLSKMLAGYRTQMLLPLTWSDIPVERNPGGFVIPNILARRAVVGDGDAILFPSADISATAAPSRKMRSLEKSPRMSLPFPTAASKKEALKPIVEVSSKSEDGVKGKRTHNPAIRITKNQNGDVSLTLPREDMDKLWSGRPDTLERRVVFSASDAGMLLVPSDDAIAHCLAGMSFVMRWKAPSWYGRGVVPADMQDRLRAVFQKAGGDGIKFIKSGRDFHSRPDLGRITLEFGHSKTSGPDFSGQRVLEAPRGKADLIADAKEHLTKAFHLLEQIRGDGGLSLEIQILDRSGSPLMNLPPNSYQAKIKLEV